MRALLTVDDLPFDPRPVLFYAATGEADAERRALAAMFRHHTPHIVRVTTIDFQLQAWLAPGMPLWEAATRGGHKVEVG